MSENESATHPTPPCLRRQPRSSPRLPLPQSWLPPSTPMPHPCDLGAPAHPSPPVVTFRIGCTTTPLPPARRWSRMALRHARSWGKKKPWWSPARGLSWPSGHGRGGKLGVVLRPSHRGQASWRLASVLPSSNRSWCRRLTGSAPGSPTLTMMDGSTSSARGRRSPRSRKFGRRGTALGRYPQILSGSGSTTTVMIMSPGTTPPVACDVGGLGISDRTVGSRGCS
jgi:hypothetical protein